MDIDNQTVVIDVIARLKDEVTGNMDDINQKVKELNVLFDKLTSSSNEDVSSISKKMRELERAIKSIKIENASKKIKDFGESSNDSKEQLDPFLESMKRTEKEVRDFTKDPWTIRLEVLDRSFEMMSRANAFIERVSGRTLSFTLRMTDLATKPLQGIYKMATNPVVAFGSVAGVSLGIKDTVDTYGDFEQTMANVKAITRTKGTEFEELKETAKNLGKTTSFSASEVAQGMTYLGMAGWDKDSIKSAMPGLLDLSLAGQTDLATTSDILSDVMTAFDIDPRLMHNKKEVISNTDHVADVFAATVTGSNTDIAMLGDTMKYAAPIAHEFQMSLEETAAISGMMANAGKDFCSVAGKLAA